MGNTHNRFKETQRSPSVENFMGMRLAGSELMSVIIVGRVFTMTADDVPKSDSLIR
ncbi:hypothetical protein PIB30_112420, partial [Stylosanthes scabra]|nr:hypothetical protein [Stylosanthes scabra]